MQTDSERIAFIEKHDLCICWAYSNGDPKRCIIFDGLRHYSGDNLNDAMNKCWVWHKNNDNA